MPRLLPPAAPSDRAAALWIAVSALVSASLAGCASRTDFVLECQAETAQPQALVFRPQRVVRHRDAEGDLHLVAFRQDATAAEPDQAWLHIQVLWQAKTTRAGFDSTTRNALVRYLVRVAGEQAFYEGMAHAVVREHWGGRTTVAIDDALLRTLDIESEPARTLGVIRLRGALSPAEDATTAVSLRREMEQRLVEQRLNAERGE